MNLKETLYHDLNKIRYQQQFNKPLVYPEPVETLKEISLRCPCEYIYSMEVHQGYMYMFCWNCGNIQYISPTQKKKLDSLISFWARK